MVHLDPWFTRDMAGKDIIAFGTGFIGKLVIPYLSCEMDIKLRGVTNSRVTTEDAGTFLETGLPIRSLSSWLERFPESTILLCVAKKNEESARAACEMAGFREIMTVPFYLVEMLLDIANPGRMPTANPTLRMMCLANEIRDIHKMAFSEFKGCHRNQTVAVVATGPTLNYYSQIKGVPHIGVNSSFLKEDIQLDYYFIRHYVPGWCEKLKNFNFVKFFARNEWAEQYYRYDRFPEYIIEENNGRRFFTGEPNNEIYEDITYYPLMGSYSIIFQALQFAFYTRPKKILLIGCDCSLDGHFEKTQEVFEQEFHKNTEKENLLAPEMIVTLWKEGYKRIKTFTEQFYFDMEIISVNPVGLKGMFHDMYTEKYLAGHPELDPVEVEVFNPKVFERN